MCLFFEMAAISCNDIIACCLPGGKFEVVSEAEGLVDVSKEVQSSVHLILDLEKSFENVSFCIGHKSLDC